MVDPFEKLMKVNDVKGLLRCGHSKLYDLINKGLFPKPIKIGRTSVWTEKEVRAWMDKAIATRDLQTAG